MNTKEKKDFLKFIKKRYDNSFYPATYNIERNCLEYPLMPKVFYFYTPDIQKLITQTGCKELKSKLKYLGL